MKTCQELGKLNRYGNQEGLPRQSQSFCEEKAGASLDSVFVSLRKERRFLFFSHGREKNKDVIKDGRSPSC